MWRSPNKSEEIQFEATKCPVCFAILGKRNNNTIFMAHCEECRATFCWRPGETKPTVQMDEAIPQRCGCNSCGR